MQQWEYAALVAFESNRTIVFLSGESADEVDRDGSELPRVLKALDAAGRDGWELVTEEADLATRGAARRTYLLRRPRATGDRQVY
jgi:hypothetical protein